MTLIISVISPHWTMQASDRRFSALDGSHHIDASNKAIFVAERLTFAFTGRTDMAGEPSDNWFQRQLSRHLRRGMTLDNAFEEIATMLSEYFAALPEEDPNCLLAFIGVGWTAGSIPERWPILAWISNFHDRDGMQLANPLEEFFCSSKPLVDRDPFLVHQAGVTLSDARWVELKARVAGLLKTGDDPDPVGRLIVETIQMEATAKEAIGPGVMLNNLPRAPGPPGGEIMLVGKRPDADVRTFTYIPEEGFDGRYLGPLVVSSDGSAIGGFEAFGPGFPDSGAGMGYSDPSAPPPPKAAVGQAVRQYRIGRNDPCWCASGKKYKKCHGR